VPRIPIFPLDVVLFPGELFGLNVFENRYVLMAEECLAEEIPIGIVLARQDQPDDLVEYEPEGVGTAAKIVKSEKVGDRYLLETLGLVRFRILKVYSEKPYQEADVEWLEEDEGDPETAGRLAEAVLARIEAAGADVDWGSEQARDPVAVSHAIASTLPFDLPTKQRLLEAQDAQERLEAEAAILDAVF
jgi:Lon protease-like protein